MSRMPTPGVSVPSPAVRRWKKRRRKRRKRRRRRGHRAVDWVVEA